MLTELNEQLSATILMVTHDAFSASYCNRILFIKDGKGQRDIFIGGQGVQKIEILKNKSQLFSSKVCKLCPVKRRDVLFFYIDMTAGDGINCGNAVQQGGFARAGSTHDAEKFSFANRKRNVVDGFCQVAFVAVKFLDVIHP